MNISLYPVTDYNHSIHVGAQPILCLKGFDPENNTELGLLNTAVLLHLTAMRCTSALARSTTLN